MVLPFPGFCDILAEKEAIRVQEHEIRDQVRKDYQKILLTPEASVITGNTDSATMSASVGYTPEELALAPEGANLGLGCGNPLRSADLKQGETVIDLGSGAGLDTFLEIGRGVV